MGVKAGLWIDGKKAVLVFLDGKKQEIRVILSNIDRHPGRVAGPRSRPNAGSRDLPAENHEERYYDKQVALYLDQVVSALRSCEAVHVFGPGEVHLQLVERMSRRGIASRIAGVESADRMTDPQIAAKVRRHFSDSKPLKSP